MGEAAHVPVGGLVAVGVTNADVVAVVALAPDLLDGAVAGRHDRRAGGAGPVDAGVHLARIEERVKAHAEARRQAHVVAAHGLAHQELVRVVALVVVVVDDAVGRSGSDRTCRRLPPLLIAV